MIKPKPTFLTQDNYPKLNNLSVKRDYRLGNNAKGSLLELPIKAILHDMDYSIKKHEITSKGLDVEGIKGSNSVIAECINWYGGYIHPLRFRSLIRNLSEPGTHKFLFAAGVSPTKFQSRVLKAMNVHIIHYQRQILKVTKQTIDFLRTKIEGVITGVNTSVVKSLSLGLKKQLSHTCTVMERLFSPIRLKSLLFSKIELLGSRLYERLKQQSLESVLNSLVGVLSLNVEVLDEPLEIAIEVPSPVRKEKPKKSAIAIFQKRHTSRRLHLKRSLGHQQYLQDTSRVATVCCSCNRVFQISNGVYLPESRKHVVFCCWKCIKSGKARWLNFPSSMKYSQVVEVTTPTQILKDILPDCDIENITLADLKITKSKKPKYKKMDPAWAHYENLLEKWSTYRYKIVLTKELK